MTSEVEGNCAVLDRVEAPVETRSAAPVAASTVNINVRFHPDGTVNMIDALPPTLQRTAMVLSPLPRRRRQIRKFTPADAAASASSRPLSKPFRLKRRTDP